MSEWDQTVQEWLIDENHCVGGALCNIETGQVYAASAMDGDGWQLMWRDDHEVPVCQEDGSEIMTKINEGATILAAASGERKPEGLWIGGEKFRIVRFQPKFDYNDQQYDVALCARSGGGMIIVKTHKTSIVLARFAEEKGQSQGNCRGAALAFAEFLSSEGY